MRVLAIAATLASAAAFAPTSLPRVRRSAATTTMAAKSKLGVGIIGCGRIGLVHLDTLAGLDFASPVIVGDFFVDVAEKVSKQYGVPEFCKEASDVINHPDVDAVWICSPSQFHADQIKECAAAGKHVFCEKPIATDLQGTYEAIAACKTADVKLMTALQRRFDPHFARVKSAIVNGEVGTPVQGRLCSRDPAPPPFDYVKGGGGIFKDMAIHDLDMARFLMGADPISVMATGSCQINDEILVLDDSAERMDTAAVLVKFPGDVVVTVEVCRQAPYGYDQRAEVLGTKGMIHTENLHPTTAKLSTAAGTGDADLPHDFFMSRYEVAYKDETAAFAKAVFADTAPPVTGDDGLMALAIALAAGKSAEENRWVEISEFVTVKDGSVVPV